MLYSQCRLLSLNYTRALAGQANEQSICSFHLNIIYINFADVYVNKGNQLQNIPLLFITQVILINTK
jgi:hypothetical protein